LSGVVKDGPGMPIQNARVTLTVTSRVPRTKAGDSRAAETGPAGEFRFLDLDPGTYQVICAAPGLEPVKQEVTIGERDDVSLPEIILDRLRSEAPFPSRTARRWYKVQKAAGQRIEVKGRVIAGGGGGALVTLVAFGASAKTPSVSTALTDREGRFALSAARPGLYGLEISKQGCVGVVALEIAVEAGDRITIKQVRLNACLKGDPCTAKKEIGTGDILH
jgi:hypothetical protein